MELDDCAFPLLASVDITDDPKLAFAGADIALLVGACPAAGMERSRSARGQRRHLQAAGQGDQRRRGRRRQGARGRQPGQHQLPDRDVERARSDARTVHGDGSPRPQPRDQPAREEARATVDDDQADDHLGQPLDHPVPRPRQRDGRRRNAAWKPSTTRPGSRTSSSPRRQARRGDHRGPRRVVRGVGRQRGDRSRARLGRSVRPTATGSRWRPLRRHLRGRRGDHLGLPCTCAGGEYTIVAGTRDRRVLARAGSTRRSPSSTRSATPSRSSA